MLLTEMVYSVPLHPSHVTSVSDGRWMSQKLWVRTYLSSVTNSGLSRGQQCPALWTSGSAPPPSTPSTFWLPRYDINKISRPITEPQSQLTLTNHSPSLTRVARSSRGQTPIPRPSLGRGQGVRSKYKCRLSDKVTERKEDRVIWVIFRLNLIVR